MVPLSLSQKQEGNESKGEKRKVDYNFCKLFKDVYNEKSSSLPLTTQKNHFTGVKHIAFIVDSLSSHVFVLNVPLNSYHLY